MRCIQPVVDRRTALERLERQRFRRFRRFIRTLLGRLPRSAPTSSSSDFNRPLPYMEIVWLPCYHIAVETTSKGVVRQANVLVGGCDRQFSLVGQPGPVFETRKDVEPFPPTIGQAEAADLAQSGLVSAVLRSPGWRGKPKIGQTRSVELVNQPYWVYYYERRPGRLDIKVLDAVTGKTPGPKTKLAMIQAFIDAGRG